MHYVDNVERPVGNFAAPKFLAKSVSAFCLEFARALWLDWPLSYKTNYTVGGWVET